MRKYLSLIAVLAMLAWVFPAGAYTIEKLPLETQAALGANWSITFTHADLTESTTNTAQSFTNIFAVVAKQSVRFIGMQLNTAFDGGNSLYTNSTAVIVGDGDDDDFYLASTEINADGTEVWRKWSSPNAGTIAVTPQTCVLTTRYFTANSTVITNGATPVDCVTQLVVAATTYVVATNATAAFTASALGQKVYTADDYIDFKFTPSGDPTNGEALNDMSAGSITFYFDIQASK